MLDLSIHSAQLYMLESLGILSPWMEENTNHRIFLHHVPDCEDYIFEPHYTVHRLATSTKIEAGGAPVQTIAFSTKQITDSIMSNWANQFRLSQYIGQHFMYSRWSVRRQDHAKAKHMAPSHLNGGTWLKDIGHPLSLTAQIVHGLTSHASIGHYRKQFKVGNQDELFSHCEGGPVETFQHILFKCLRHPTWPPDMPNFTEATPYWEHFGKFIMDNPTVYAFVDSPAYSQTMDYRTRMVAHWAKGAPTSTHSQKAKSQAHKHSLGDRALPSRSVPIGHELFERGIHGCFSHCLATLTTMHVNVSVIHRSINPCSKGNSSKIGVFFMLIRNK